MLQPAGPRSPSRFAALADLSLSIDWINDPRSRRMGELLATLWVLALADLFFTLWAHFFTPFHELNPLARTLLGQNLIPSLVIYKLTITLLGTAIFWRLRGYRRAEIALLAVVIVYVLLAMRWSDYTQGAVVNVATPPPGMPVNC